MMRHSTLCSILLLAASCIMAGRAGTTTTTLKACRVDAITAGAIVLILVSSTPTDEASYPGEMDGTDTNCAVFTWTEDFLPSSSARTYKFIVSDIDGTTRGSVTYSMTFTASQLSCNGTEFVRFSMETVGDHLSDTTCSVPILLDDTALHSICYVPKTDPVTVCADKLDDTLATTTVCMPATPANVAPSTSTVKALSYTNKRLTANDTTVSEMLIRKHVAPPTVPNDFTLKLCNNEGCDVSNYIASEDYYELCFVSSDQNVITGVAQAGFQDLALVTLPSATSIDLRFLNLGPEMKYKIYKTDMPDAIVDTSQTPINLDCSNIAAGSYCYGFYEPADGILPNFIAISYDDNSNMIISLDNFPTPPLEQ